MRKITFIILLSSLLFFSGCQITKKDYNKNERKTFGEMTGSITRLPEPNQKGQMNLEETISKRCSKREFSDTSLSKEHKSSFTI